MFKYIIQKEILSAFRDIRLQITGIILFTLMIVTLLVGYNREQKIKTERDKAQELMQEAWVNQEDKHPHSAAHYGHFAFKPRSILSFMDIGIENFTGTSVFLEAHKRNEILFSNAQDSESISRFGDMTLGIIFQVFMPLLIIFFTFNIFSKEREDGTLKLTFTQGLSTRKLFFGKVISVYFMVMMLFLPIVIISYVIFSQKVGDITNDSIIKFFTLISFYLIYFFVFVILSVLISGFSKNSKSALMSLLGIWILFCIIIPKATNYLANTVYPVPSRYEFQTNINRMVQNGIDGHNPSDNRLDSLKQKALIQYNVSSIDSLPVNWGGIAMQAGEEYTDKVYDHEFSKIEAAFKKQNRFSEWISFLNPYLAIRNLSMGLSGTDYNHHVSFARAAENYRRDFVKKMNKDMEINHLPGVSYNDYNVGKEIWNTIEPFEYNSPKLSEVLFIQLKSIFALVLWLLSLCFITALITNLIPKNK